MIFFGWLTSDNFSPTSRFHPDSWQLSYTQTQLFSEEGIQLKYAEIPDFPAKISRKNVTLTFLDDSISISYIGLMLLGAQMSHQAIINY